MRFSERAFLEGGREVEQLRRDRANQAQMSLQAAYQADDTQEIEEARRILEGPGGLKRLFDNEKRGNNLKNPFANKTNLLVADMKNMNGPDVYRQLEVGFEDALKGARTNSQRARIVREYQNSLAKADRYFKNTGSDRNINVRDYLMFSGQKGRPEKLEDYYYGGKLIQASKGELSTTEGRESALKRYGIKYNRDTDFVPASRAKHFETLNADKLLEAKELAGEIKNYDFLDYLNPFKDKSKLQKQYDDLMKEAKGIEYFDQRSEPDSFLLKDRVFNAEFDNKKTKYQKKRKVKF